MNYWANKISLCHWVAKKKFFCSNFRPDFWPFTTPQLYSLMYEKLSLFRNEMFVLDEMLTNKMVQNLPHFFCATIIPPGLCFHIPKYRTFVANKGSVLYMFFVVKQYMNCCNICIKGRYNSCIFFKTVCDIC